LNFNFNFNFNNNIKHIVIVIDCWHPITNNDIDGKHCPKLHYLPSTVYSFKYTFNYIHLGSSHNIANLPNSLKNIKVTISKVFIPHNLIYFETFRFLPSNKKHNNLKILKLINSNLSQFENTHKYSYDLNVMDGLSYNKNIKYKENILILSSMNLQNIICQETQNPLHDNNFNELILYFDKYLEHLFYQQNYSQKLIIFPEKLELLTIVLDDFTASDYFFDMFLFPKIINNLIIITQNPTDRTLIIDKFLKNSHVANIQHKNSL